MLLIIEITKIISPKINGTIENLNGLTPAVFNAKISLFADRLEKTSKIESSMAMGKIKEFKDGIIYKINFIKEKKEIFPEITLSSKSAIFIIIKKIIKIK